MARARNLQRTPRSADLGAAATCARSLARHDRQRKVCSRFDISLEREWWLVPAYRKCVAWPVCDPHRRSSTSSARANAKMRA